MYLLCGVPRIGPGPVKEYTTRGEVAGLCLRVHNPWHELSATGGRATPYSTLTSYVTCCCCVAVPRTSI